jgi:hypothetical protein
MMNLYLLQYRDEHYSRHEYDEVRAAVVAAASSREAREILWDNRPSDKTAGDWLVASWTSCKWIGTARQMKPGVILLDIHEG